jgi:phosphate transport system substrate-binding protein
MWFKARDFTPNKGDLAMKTYLNNAVRALVLGGALIAAAPASAAEISGAGATFPYPIYAKWAEAYKAKTGTAMNYQSIGSGGGIKQIKARTVDFGASDAPLKADDLKEAGLVQFPAIIGGVVPVVNLPGINPGQLKLDGALLADLFMGKVTSWDDARIAKDNPGVKLPKQAISIVRRSDGSGTTFVYTSFLGSQSEEWKTKVGVNNAVEWPVGVGGKGNEGVAAMVGQTLGSIGYVEYAYAKQNKLIHTLVRNKDGKYPVPGAASFQTAAASADWKNAAGYNLILVDQPGADSWPITAASFILLPAKADKPENAAEVLKFFDWSFANGKQLATDLDYVPLPDALVALIRQTWSGVVTPAGAPVWKS